MASEIHVGDIGTRFLATIKDDGIVVNVSGAEYITMMFRKPNDQVLNKIGTLYTDGTDGKVYYDATAGDLDEAGQYKLQAKVNLPSGIYYTDIYTFQVHCNL